MYKRQLFDYHRFGKNGVFQIDANFGCTAGVCEMLVQSNLGYIDILPALPKEWSDGSFCGITAEGAFEINASWQNMRLIKAEIISHKGGKCRVKMKENMSVTDSEGNSISVVRDGDIIEFETMAEKKYTIK